MIQEMIEIEDDVFFVLDACEGVRLLEGAEYYIVEWEEAGRRHRQCLTEWTVAQASYLNHVEGGDR